MGSEESAININRELQQQKEFSSGISLVRKTIRVEYDVERDGGEIGTILSGVKLPFGAHVLKTYYLVNKTFASGGAAQVDILAFDGAGAIGCLSDLASNLSAGGSLVDGALTAVGSPGLDKGAEIQIDISVADLTAGQLFLFIDYVVIPEFIYVGA